VPSLDTVYACTLPGAPGVPGGPSGPASPSAPERPISPRRPRSPRAPAGPAAPGTPFLSHETTIGPSNWLHDAVKGVLPDCTPVRMRLLVTMQPVSIPPWPAAGQGPSVAAASTAVAPITAAIRARVRDPAGAGSRRRRIRMRPTSCHRPASVSRGRRAPHAGSPDRAGDRAPADARQRLGVTGSGAGPSTR
jgi:hypothetical protein